MDVQSIAKNVGAVVDTEKLKQTARDAITYRYMKMSNSKRLAKFATWIVSEYVHVMAIGFTLLHLKRSA